MALGADHDRWRPGFSPALEQFTLTWRCIYAKEVFPANVSLDVCTTERRTKIHAFGSCRCEREWTSVVLTRDISYWNGVIKGKTT